MSIARMIARRIVIVVASGKRICTTRHTSAWAKSAWTILSRFASIVTPWCMCWNDVAIYPWI